MYLKNIEVYGFKSFANKINFEFHNGITGIVGPNGSGKSNVADAVRWVLGEQSAKQLRGANMQDVIFSGTELRKPMGYAYVAITLDNSDHKLPVEYEEVTVSRRVYRSGESEYLINGISCRLKDVYEMFYDTGVGKEGYSIIGQGQIDKILSGKPEERRELFDEAAGIVKFKKKKAASVKKLESERQNLVRVSDILSEKEKQVGPLKEQSDVAKVYLEKKDKLKSLDINLFLIDSERTKKEMDDYAQKLELAEEELEKARAESDKTNAEYESLSDSIKELEDSIQKKREELSHSGLMKEKLEGSIRLYEEQINSSKNNINTLNNRKKSSEERKTAQEKELEELMAVKLKVEKDFKSIKDQGEDNSENLKSLKQSIEDIEAEINRSKEEVMELVKDRGVVKEDIGRFDTMLEQTRLKKADIQSQLIKAKSEEEEHEEEMKKLYNELNDINALILKLSGEISDKEAYLASFKKKLEDKDNELQEANLNFMRKRSQLESRRNIAERYEGYNSAIRRVMEEKERQGARVIGVVADILKVDEKYETAIETALGGNIQNIITEDGDTAKKMINFLKSTRGGRATFLPLTSVKGRGEYKKSEVRNEKGFIGIASELVKAEKKYDEVISHLLGEILIVDKYDNAKKMAEKYDQLLRIVTLDGEYFTPGGAVSGGYFKNSSNLLGRNREINTLTEEMNEAKKKIGEASKAIEDIKAERTSERNNLENLKNQMQELSIKQNSAELNIESLEKKKDNTKDNFDKLNIMKDDLEKQLKAIADDKENVNRSIAESENREKELNNLIAELGNKLSAVRDEETDFVRDKADIDVKLSKLTAEMDHAGKDVERVKNEIDRLTKEIGEIDEQLDSENAGIKNKEHDISEVRKTIAASADMKDTGEDEINEKLKEKEKLSEKQKGFVKTTSELNDRIVGLEKEVYRLDTQKKRLEENEEKQASYMWSEYEMTLNKAQTLRDESLDDPLTIRKEISSLKAGIKALGNVNVNAIESYKQVKEEYDFLKKQHDDLIEAEKTLNEIIENLDAAMRKQFGEKFNEIAEEFNKVFRELFGGGKGTVELAENEDILEAGIRVIAQPPGKKLQNMMQLSGGEKALTAIALLFAIQNLKPSPFCLLDEIEAALDESNVGRFAGYLHKLTEHTQFIVITHRRGTMEKADRLYGITMQEKGVSALVSVSLIDKDLDD